MAVAVSQTHAALVLIRAFFLHGYKGPGGVSGLVTHWPLICPSAQGHPTENNGQDWREAPGSLPGSGLLLRGRLLPSALLGGLCAAQGVVRSERWPSFWRMMVTGSLSLPQGDIGLGSVLSSLTLELAVSWRSGVQRLAPKLTVTSRCQGSWALCRE